MQEIEAIIRDYGIYAVFALCTVEGDVTLLLSGVMAHSNFFGDYSFWKVLAAGITGGVIGDTFGYFIGRVFRETVKGFRFYRHAQPRIERLIDKFGGLSLVISKYIYGIRVAMVVFNGVGNMPFWRFLLMDFISCTLWAAMLAGIGYFFSGAISSIIGDFQQLGIALFVILAIGIGGFYLMERYWLSKKVEEADPETIQKIEDKLHDIEEVAQEKLHDIGERLHLTNAPNRDDIAHEDNIAPTDAEKILESRKNSATK